LAAAALAGAILRGGEPGGARTADRAGARRSHADREGARARAGPAAIIEASGWPDYKGAVIIVGHQPDLGRVAAHLVAGAQASWSIKKGGCGGCRTGCAAKRPRS